MDCLFCKIIEGSIPSRTIYEDDLVKVFLDINPNTNGHCLIIPKKHIVTVNELDTFLAENLDPIVYIEVSEDENSRDVAKDLINVVKERNLTERVVYVNLSSVENKDAFFSDFTSKYMDGKKLEYYPSLLIFSEGKVVAFVSRTEKQALRISDVEQLFDEFELEGE